MAHLALAALLAAVLGSSGASAGLLRVLVRQTPNKTETNRTAKTIDRIVIHDTEGRFLGSVRALQAAGREASAHFVVSRRGTIVQLVPVTDVAWHAGNRFWNLHSIGIEHEGWADRPGSYTAAEYRASAQLVAYLAHRWGILLDRRHIVGHDEVPDPHYRGLFGGVSHHTDPGPYWNWPLYMRLVRFYSAHPVLPTFVHPRATTTWPAYVDRGASLRGTVQWWSGIDAWRRAARGISRVDFLVDGRTLYTDHTWPFSFHRSLGWNSWTVPNGRHMLTVVAHGAHGYRTRERIPVRVDNPPLRLTVTGAVSGGAVAGVLRLAARPSGPVERVVLYADGRPVSRDSTPPYSLAWDTTRETEGEHTLLLAARDRHGHRASLALPVLVANAPAFPDALSRNWVTHHVLVPGADSFGVGFDQLR